MEVRIKKLSKDNPLDKQVFCFLFGKYAEELKKYGNLVTITSEDAEKFMTFKDTSVYLIIADAITSGFFIIGQPPANCPKTCDYYIQEFYVQDKSQNKGIGKLAIKEFISSHEGKYFMYVLNNNTRALSFWDKVISSAHCVKYQPEENIDAIEGTTSILFKTT